MNARILLLAAAATLGTVACGPDYDRTEITGVVTGSIGGEINFQHVVVPQGSLIKAHIVSINTDGKNMASQVHSADPSTCDAIQVVSDRDYAFLGVKPGQTTIEVKADDKTVLVLDAVVTEQPAPPQ